MRDAGVKYVRMGEFAWSHLERTEGSFDFQWLHDAVNLFGEYGIQTMLCTPSSAAPAWMCRNYPDILRMKRNGERACFGLRDHTCYTSKTYRRLVTRIVEKLAAEFAGDPNVFAWQIDNEAGCSLFSDCFCPDCQQAFREFLKQKYASVDQLNRAWSNAFWSGEYGSFDEIELPANEYKIGSSIVAEAWRFRSEEQCDFVLFQANLIRKRIPDAVIGTNNYCSADPYRVFGKLDYVGGDLYPWESNQWKDFTRSVDAHRGYKPGTAPWLIETHPSPNAPEHDLMRFYLLIAEAVCALFRLRPRRRGADRGDCAIRQAA